MYFTIIIFANQKQKDLRDLCFAKSLFMSVLDQADLNHISNISRFIHYCAASFVTYEFLFSYGFTGVSSFEMKYDSETEMTEIGRAIAAMSAT